MTTEVERFFQALVETAEEKKKKMSQEEKDKVELMVAKFVHKHLGHKQRRELQHAGRDKS